MPYKSKEDLYIYQAAHRRKNFERLWELLSHSSCKDCGNSNPIVLEFDHLPGTDKKFEIGKAVSGSTRSWKAIEAEIDKCEIVCANCHKIRGSARGSWQKTIELGISNA